MADLWGRRDQLLMGGLTSDDMFMSWPELNTVGGGLFGFGLGLLIQRLGMQYRQPIRRIFELGPGVAPLMSGSNLGNAAFCDLGGTVTNLPTVDCNKRVQATYYIVGRPEGRLNLDRFIGPAAITCGFYSKYGSPCSSNLLTISGRAGCGVAAGNVSTGVLMTWQLNGVVLDDYQGNVTGQEMVMQEGIGAMFTSLKVSTPNDSTCT